MANAPVARSFQLSAAQVSAVGGRQSNQDALGSVERDDLACYVVADGAGGYEGGEIAAAITVESVVTDFDDRTTFGEPTLKTWIAQAMDEVARGKHGAEHLSSMKATVAVALLDKQQGMAMWAHLGDTRVYLFRAGRLLQATRDHSLVQQLIDAGLTAGGDTRNHPKRHMLYAAIGADGEEPPAIQQPLALQDGDALLICTDGLWEWVTEEVMEQCLVTASSVQHWLDAMCAAADARAKTSPDARDNYTAQAIWVAHA
jgi:serine/threonine protein phosphatase PrpC